MGYLSEADLAPAPSGKFISAKDVIPEGVPTAEEEALQPVAEDPISEIQKHPYVAAGLMGAAMGPAALAPLAGESALAGPALGAAEQMGYQGIADLGAKAAGPEHPYLGMVPGLIAPALAGGLSSKMSGLPKAQIEAARSAADTAESKVYENAPEQLYDYGTKVDKALDKQLESTGKALKTGQTALTDVQRQATKEMAPKIAQQQLEQFTGRTPEDTAAAMTADPQEFAARRKFMRQVVLGPSTRIGDELGTEFESATKDKLGNPGKMDAVEKTVTNEQKWLSDHNTELAKPVKDLIAEMPVAEVDEGLRAKIPDLLRGKGEAGAQSRFNDLMKEWDKTHGQRLTQDDMQGLALKALGAKGEQPTVGDLLGWRTKATKLVGSTADHNQVVALQLRDAIDQSLVDSGVEISPELRERWGSYKSLFNSQFRHQVATAADPTMYGKALFEQPQRALQVIKQATPEEQAGLRQLFGDYVNRAKLDPMKLGKRVNPEVMKELFGNSPYAQIKPWLETEPKAVAWQNFRQTNPAAERIVQQKFRDEIQTISAEKAADVRKAGIELAQKMGPAGRGKLAKILAEKDPSAAARVVEDEFPVSPQQAQQMYQQAQSEPGKVALRSFREGKQLEKGLDINKAREDAAVQQLMKDQHNPIMSQLKRRLFAWHLPMMIGGAMAGGKVGGYQGAISGMILGMMGANKVASLFRPSLDTPEAAAAYWHAIENTPNTLNAGRHGAMLARGLVAATLAQTQPQEDDNEEEVGN